MREMNEGDRFVEISGADLYHRLGKLEGLIELNSQALLATQNNLQALTSALGALQNKQSVLEGSFGSHKSSTNSVVDIVRSFAIPILAIVVSYGVAVRTVTPESCPADQALLSNETSSQNLVRRASP